MSIGGRIVAKAAKTRVEAKAFHTAYKAAPGQTLGTWSKNHKFGIGLTAVSFAPSPFHASPKRRSTHQGVQQKGGVV